MSLSIVNPPANISEGSITADKLAANARTDTVPLGFTHATSIGASVYYGGTAPLLAMDEWAVNFVAPRAMKVVGVRYGMYHTSVTVTASFTLRADGANTSLSWTQETGGAAPPVEYSETGSVDIAAGDTVSVSAVRTAGASNFTVTHMELVVEWE